MCRPRSSRAFDSLETCELRSRLCSIASLEDPDRPRQRADLVGAIGMGNLDILGSVGDLA